MGCSKQKIMKNNRLQKRRFASFSKTPLNPVEIQYSCGFSAYHLSKNRAYVLNVTSGTLPLPRRFARYARSSTCGERSRHSLGLQGFDIWFGGVGADRRRRAKEHQTPVQRKTAENPRPMRAGRKGGKARRALKKIIPALTGFERKP